MEAEKIAKGLTEAQARNTIAMRPYEPNYAAHNEGSKYASLVRAGVAYKTQPVRGGWPYYKLTLLGLEVRRILENPNAE